jgi:branched-chain amino acid transport system substrate-binding protein
MAKKIWIVIVTALGVALIVCWFIIRPTEQAQNGATIRIGAMLPLTGDAAAWGKQARDAIELATAQFNAPRTAVRILVDYQDTKAEPKEAVVAANFLIFDRKVAAIIGDMTSASTLAAAPLCERNKVVLLSPVASSPLISGAGEYIYRIWPSDVFEAEFTADWLMAHGFKKAAVVYLTDDFGVPLKDTFRSKYEKKGGQVVFQEGYAKGTSDFRPIILKLRRHKPTVLYLVSHYADAAQFAKRSKEQAFDIPTIGTADLMNEEFLHQAGSAAEGFQFPMRKGFDPNEASPRVTAFVQQFQARYGRVPGLVEAQSFDAASVVLNAVGEGARSGVEIKRKLDGLAEHPFAGVTGSIAFDERGDLALGSVNFRMARVQDGRFTPAE